MENTEQMLVPQGNAKKKTHLITLGIVIAATLFVIFASVWILSDTSSKTKQEITPTPIATPTFVPGPTISPPSTDYLNFIQEELESGDKQRISQVLIANSQASLDEYLKIVGEIKRVVFDEKSFTRTNDPNVATIKTSITEDIREYTQKLTLITHEGQWKLKIGK